MLWASAFLFAFGCTKEDIPPKTYEEFTVNGVSFKMIKVEAGTFKMGSPIEEELANSNEYPLHQVTLTKTYYIGETEATQELWKAVMGTDPSHFTGNPRYPVEMVSWEDIVNEFLPKLNALTGKTFSLPTEAQWEYAARGGNKSKCFRYSGSNDPDEVSWYGVNGEEGTTHEVGLKLPNELGLYDMCGNVWEWCFDHYGDYSEEPQTDPAGPETGEKNIFRGGCYATSIRQSRVASRNYTSPSVRHCQAGFRLALVM